MRTHRSHHDDDDLLNGVSAFKFIINTGLLIASSKVGHHSGEPLRIEPGGIVNTLRCFLGDALNTRATAIMWSASP
jgi:hypothetical protein